MFLAAMKVPPKKPHFFKPIQSGFKNGLKIPIGFLKYLKGHDQHEHAILRRAGKKCLVKLNEHRFEEGWGKFAEEHDVQLGDMLVFRHEGKMEFEVSIFDSTHCDREYAEYMQIQEEDEDEDEDEDDEEKNEDEVQEEGETSKKFEFNGKIFRVYLFILDGFAS
ncbi:B3 domain-containing protein REM9-like [Solanum dulcamara]|uniref:B3 domain-containing protein REM9-like n=1 Tax=Solanum dulcamara TaxID=45834 RepID=UPI002486CD8C|nr:B3 domain-containing protein REM9-like [Solanum dulcamara]